MGEYSSFLQENVDSEERNLDKTILPQSPFSSCSRTFNITCSSLTDGVCHGIVDVHISITSDQSKDFICPRWFLTLETESSVAAEKK